MSDIALRFGKDMLTLTAPLEPGLAAQGVDTDKDVEFMALVEPDTIRDAYRLQMVGEPQVLVTATRGITPARLARHNMEGRLEDLCVASLTVARSMNPQHILVEMWPCGLPLDPDSATSMKEHRDQYARVAKVYEALDKNTDGTGATAFDGYLLSGFSTVAALKAAIAGIRKVSDKPLFASVVVDGYGLMGSAKKETLEEAIAVMEEFGADVCGFATYADESKAYDLVQRAVAVTAKPVLVSLAVAKRDPKQGEATPENPYYSPDTMITAAVKMRAAGAQFVRATSAASPAYTAVIAAALTGRDVVKVR